MAPCCAYGLPGGRHSRHRFGCTFAALPCPLHPPQRRCFGLPLVHLLTLRSLALDRSTGASSGAPALRAAGPLHNRCPQRLLVWSGGAAPGVGVSSQNEFSHSPADVISQCTCDMLRCTFPHAITRSSLRAFGACNSSLMVAIDCELRFPSPSQFTSALVRGEGRDHLSRQHRTRRRC